MDGHQYRLYAGYILSFIANYYLSKYFTFKTNPDIKKGIGFTISHAINYGLHIILFNGFIRAGISQSLAPLFVYAIVIPVNFMLVRLALKGK